MSIKEHVEIRLMVTLGSGASERNIAFTEEEALNVHRILGEHFKNKADEGWEKWKPERFGPIPPVTCSLGQGVVPLVPNSPYNTHVPGKPIGNKVLTNAQLKEHHMFLKERIDASKPDQEMDVFEEPIDCVLDSILRFLGTYGHPDAQPSSKDIHSMARNSESRALMLWMYSKTRVGADDDAEDLPNYVDSIAQLRTFLQGQTAVKGVDTHA